MKLLLSSHGASPFGAERVLLILAEGLGRRGHDVTLEIPHEGPAVEVARELANVRVWLSGRPRLPRNTAEAARYLAGAGPALLRLRREIRARAFDAVWVNSLFNPLAALAARSAGAGVVWHLHERNFRNVAAWPTAWLLTGVAHERVAVSRFVADTFERAPGAGGRFRVLHEQFDPLPAMPLPEDGPFTVGYVGQFEPRKRVPDVLSALAGVEDAVGLLVGAGKREEEVREAVKGLGLEDRVELPGFQRDMAAWYRRMHCVVVPSRDEPCPLVALEAMSAGRPVVASDHGGHPEVLGDAGLLYPLGDVDALRAHIRRLRDEPALRTDLARRGIERARTFDRERWLDRAEEIADSAARAARGESR